MVRKSCVFQSCNEAKANNSSAREWFENLSLKCRWSCLVGALCKEQQWSWGEFVLHFNSLVQVWASKVLMAGVECAVRSYQKLITSSHARKKERQCSAGWWAVGWKGQVNSCLLLELSSNLILPVPRIWVLSAVFELLTIYHVKKRCSCINGEQKKFLVIK